MSGVYHFWWMAIRFQQKTSRDIENPWNIKVGEYFYSDGVAIFWFNDCLVTPKNKPKFKRMDMVMSNHPSFSNPNDLGNRNHPIETAGPILNRIQHFRVPNLGFPGVNEKQTPRFLPKVRSFEEAFGRLFHIRVFPDNPRVGDFGTLPVFGWGGFG